MHLHSVPLLREPVHYFSPLVVMSQLVVKDKKHTFVPQMRIRPILVLSSNFLNRSSRELV
jgi:hypothetical protein